jgi:hypothetical protein
MSGENVRSQFSLMFYETFLLHRSNFYVVWCFIIFKFLNVVRCYQIYVYKIVKIFFSNQAYLLRMYIFGQGEGAAGVRIPLESLNFWDSGLRTSHPWLKYQFIRNLVSHRMSPVNLPILATGASIWSRTETKGRRHVNLKILIFIHLNIEAPQSPRSSWHHSKAANLFFLTCIIHNSLFSPFSGCSVFCLSSAISARLFV